MEYKIHTPMQRKGLTKLLGLTYIIQYRHERENLVIDALFKKEDLDTNTTLNPDTNKKEQ